MKNRTSLKQVSLFRVIFLLLLVICLTTGVVSSFVTGSHSADLARVAKFVFDVSMDQQTVAASFNTLEGQIRKPGDSADFELQVTNTKGDATAEVSVQYDLALAIDGSMPLTCTLKQGDRTVMTWSNVGAVPPVGQTPAVYTAELAPGAEVTDHYILNVCWPAEENSRRYANGSAAGELVVTFTAQQVD